MEQTEFLSRQFNLLSQRLNDPTIEWQDVADLRAEYTGEDEHRDTIRKGAKLFYEYLEAGWIKNPAESSTVTPSEATVQMRELQKERYKIQTEKLELNRWLRENARDELIVEHICQAVEKLEPLVIPDPIHTELLDREGVLLFGDEHYGTEFEIRGLHNEIINSYSPEVFESRMWNLLDQVVSIVRKEGFSQIHVFSMGDFEDGLGQFTRNYTQTVKRAADNKRRYAPGWVHSTCLLRGFPKGAAPHLAHDFAEQSVVCYTLCRRCPENTVAAGEGKGI